MSRASVFISTGEPSGDAVGAFLLREMRSLGFAGDAFAMGGTRLKNAGARVVEDTTNWGSIGVMQALGKAPQYLSGARRVLKWLDANSPSLVIPIDFGFFNVRMARRAKERNCKVLYFMPPGSWKRHSVNNDLGLICDKIATQFPWSADLLREQGADVEWVGHPVKQMLGEIPPVEGRAAIAILPGSRQHEVALNLPMIGEAIDRVDTGDRELLVACAASTNLLWAEKLWRECCKKPAKLTNTGASSALKQAYAAVVCSGTATLEAAVCRVPMVVVYAFSTTMKLEAAFVRKAPKYIALPSILLQEPVAPELYYTNATASNIAAELARLLTDSEARRRQLHSFEKIDQALGPDNAVTRAAEIAMSMLSPEQSPASA